jgi:SAM-dependent methyltransferase
MISISKIGRDIVMINMNDSIRNYARTGHMGPEECQDNWIYLLEKYANGIDKKVILDVGCGKGQLVKELSKQAKYVVGIDSSEALKNYNNEWNYYFIRADCHNLPFKENVFDLVISIGMLEHITSYERAILEMKRALKQHGYMLLFAGPTPFWRSIDLPAHRSIIVRNPSPTRVLALLKDGNCKKVWGDNISYRLFQMPSWKLKRGPRYIQSLFEFRLIRHLCVHILSIFERLNLEQNFCIIYSKSSDYKPK